MFFADDIILAAKANDKTAHSIKNTLEKFCLASGLRVSLSKSTVYFAPKTVQAARNRMVDILDFCPTSHLGKYLGVKVTHSRNRSENFRELIEKVQHRLSGWKAKNLNLAGRATLIQSVTSALPIYSMHSNWIPTKVCDQLDRLNRAFLWGSIDNIKKIHLVGWDKIICCKSKGGLGIRDSRKTNLAMLAKTGWRVFQKDETVWSKIFRVMVRSVENGTTLAPFLVKCYDMVNDESTNDLISWTESNDSFIIWDESKFASQLLPKYFKHSNFSSFVRQLNIYGFRKIDTDRWQFANEAFIKGQKHLLKNITRRKQPQNLVQRKSSQQKEIDPPSPPEEDKRIALWKEVENLKNDRNALTQELKKLTQHQQTSQSKLLLLREQLKGMEKNQQQMLSFIVMAMQSPEFLVQFFQPKENNWIMAEAGKSKLSEVTDDCEPNPSDGAIVRYQPPEDKYSGPECTTADANIEDFMDFDFASDEMRDLLMDIDFFLDPESVDENSFSVENNGPHQFVLPDIHGNDNMMEQLLLSNPSPENELEGEGKESNMSNGSDDDNEYHNQITEAIESRNTSESSEKVEILTKQMGYLGSEMTGDQ
ncbi:hypothetical protein BUALT_Bualt05G0102300 [Buddleja alternifolia]|uniref:Heat stress transcription factor n=1 Tax=Buddleja alternifolia TaxID=168488 RepID=A0AAV6XI94_9LAMI|nr:hypothetical protein BUALT_Bualt05G0102300 [Buddleja alternifolia]